MTALKISPFTSIVQFIFELRHEKNVSSVFPIRSDTNQAAQPPKMARGFKFRIRKKRACTFYVAKTKALISCAVAAQLIDGFIITYVKSRFSHVAAHFTFGH